MKYVYQMVTFGKFRDEDRGFFVDYEFDQFCSSRKNAIYMCKGHVEYLVENHEVLSAALYDYKSPCGRYQVIYEVVGDGRVEFYGIVRRLVF